MRPFLPLFSPSAVVFSSFSGSAGTTEPIPEQSDEPLDSEGGAEADIPADAEVTTTLGGDEAGSGEITADTTENESESTGS